MMGNTRTVEAYKQKLIQDIGKIMVRFKYDLIEFAPTFRIYIEDMRDNDFILVPSEVIYMHGDGTLGLMDKEEIDLNDLTIHDVAYILDYLEANNYKPVNVL